ncbi:MAG TPA: tripartite tricarboxylate transporter substrate binding protein [Burkholderiales bacterium]|nr:tripartite tricarboxylate transporter substrate binding protein [Burkholderiales bacterium]
MKAIAFLAALLFAAGAAAQGYPNQPIKMISPFPPGGSVDIMARLIADPLAAQLGGRIVVENRSGASGNIGMEAAARSAPDGYTLVLNTIPLVTNVSLFEKLSWDPIRDFAPIGMVATAPHVLIVPRRLQANNVQELLTLARANPGKMSYASAGYGTTFHFAAEMFKDITKTFILHVPYRGGGPALVDTLSGQVDMSFPTLSAVLPHVKAGNLKALAVTGATRSELLPDVPTMEQAGVKDFVFTQWLALVAPAAIPRDIVTKLNTSLNTALGSKELREKFQQQGFEPFTTTPEDAGKFLAGEVKRYSSLIRSKGIKAE